MACTLSNGPTRELARVTFREKCSRQQQRLRTKKAIFMKYPSILASIFLAAACAASPKPVQERVKVGTKAKQGEAVPLASLPINPGTVQGALDLLPTGITSFGAAVQDGSLYLLGGFYGTPHEYVPEFQSAALMRLPLDGASKWQAMPGLEAGLQSVALVPAAGALHRLGGMRIEAADNLRSVDEHARFIDGAWEKLPAMPEARSSHDAVVVGDKIYVVGGWKLTGDRGGTFFDEMWIYSEAKGWETLPSPVNRRAIAVAATDSHLVVIGGLGPDRKMSSEVNLYNLQSGEWTQGPSFPGEKNGFGVSAVGVLGQIYASGRDGILWSLEPGAKEWKQEQELTFPRFFHRLVSPDPETLVAVGGIGGMHTYGRTRHVETINLSAQQSESLVAWSLPSPVPAKNRQGVFLRDDQLILFGGNNSMGQHDFDSDNFVDNAYSIHIPSLSSGEVASYPARRQTMQTLMLKDTGVSVGGFGHDGSVARTHSEAFSYDTEENTWKSRPGMPVPRSQFGLVHHENSLWVFGGLDYDPTREAKDQFRHLTSVLKAPADGSSPFVPTKVELPGPRRAFGGALHEGHYYLVGGMRGGFQLVKDCKSFDFGKKKWSEIPCPQSVRLNPQLVPVGEQLVLVGGSAKIGEKLAEDPSIEVYNPKTKSWRTLSVTLPFPAKHMRAFAYRGQLLIYSAHNDEGLVHLGLVSLGE